MKLLKRQARRLAASLGRTRPGKLILWKALPGCGVERVALRTDDGMFMVSTRDNMIALSLFMEGNFDKQLVDRSCSMAIAYLGRENLTYVDIGANIGSNTVYALLHPAFSRGICFEPEATNFSNLNHTVLMNGMADRVRCICTALGDAEGRASLELSMINFGDHQIIPINDPKNLGETVQMTTLNASLTKEELARVGLVCIDVQGYEAQVFSGASNLLSEDVPVLCEITPDQIRRCGRYDQFFHIAARSFNWFVDMREPTRQRGISELRVCADSIRPGGHTDVFLTKRRV